MGSLSFVFVVLLRTLTVLPAPALKQYIYGPPNSLAVVNVIHAVECRYCLYIVNLPITDQAQTAATSSRGLTECYISVSLAIGNQLDSWNEYVKLDAAL